MGLLLEGIRPTEVTARLRLYEKVRMGRARAVQVFSRFGQDQSNKIKQEVEKIEGWKGTVPGKENETPIPFRHNTARCQYLRS